MRNFVLTTSAATAIAAATVLCAVPASAETCLLDRDDNGEVDAGIDNDGAATDNGGDDTALACGVGANASKPGAIALGAANSTGTNSVAAGTGSKAFGNDSVAVGRGARSDDASSVAIGHDSRTSQVGSVAIGVFSEATGTRSVAVGENADATASESVALGRDAKASGVSSLASGVRSQASATQAMALGAESRAAGTSAIAIGGDGVDDDALGAQALLDRGIAMGADAFSNGVNATAISSAAQATGANSTSVGFAAIASNNGAAAFGGQAIASGSGGTAVGRVAVASGTSSTAVGRGATASSIRTTAVGFQAVAALPDSTAIGSGATTTAANQVAIGGTGSSVQIGDIDASTLAQVGPVDVVTVDANGTLGRGAAASAGSVTTLSRSLNAIAAVSDAQFDALSGDVAALTGRVGNLEQQVDVYNQETNGGIAAAMALGGTMIVPDSTVSVNFNLATYRGEQGFAGTIAARVAPKIYISGGFTGSSVKGSSGGRVGVAFGF